MAGGQRTLEDIKKDQEKAYKKYAGPKDGECDSSRYAKGW